MYYIIAFLSVDVMTFREIRHLATNKKNTWWCYNSSFVLARAY